MFTEEKYFSYHVPQDSTFRRCAFCRITRRKQVRSALSCSACGVALCRACFKPYHWLILETSRRGLRGVPEEWNNRALRTAVIRSETLARSERLEYSQNFVEANEVVNVESDALLEFFRKP